MSLTRAELDAAAAFMADVFAQDYFTKLSIPIEKMEYQGFDPTMVIAVALKRGVAAGKTAEVAKSEIFTLAIIGTMRGSNVTNILKRSLEELKTFLTAAKIVYQIKDGKPASNTDVTLVRLAACFSAQVSIGLMNGTIPASTVSPAAISIGFPIAMCSSTFGSLIPNDPNYINDDDSKLLQNAFSYHQKKFDGVINPKNPTAMTRLQQFIDLQLKSNLYSETTKIKTLKDLGILTGKAPSVITPRYKQAIKDAADAWLNIAANF